MELQTKQWRPHKVQADFLAIPDSIHEALYGGAMFGGKSEVLLYLPLVREFYRHPKFNGIIFRRTFPELEKSLIERSHKDGLYKATGALWNDQKKRWKWPSGATMYFGHLEYDRDVTQHDSSEYSYEAFDELTSFTEYQYLYLVLQRLRSPSINLPAIARSGTTPGNIGHGWVRKRFVEPAPNGRKIIVQKVGDRVIKRIFIPAKATDNIYGMKNDPGYIDKLNALPEAERRAKRDGDWWTFSGQALPDFRIFPFPGEPSSAQHVIEPFDIPSYWPKVLAIDWGGAGENSAPTCAYKGAIAPWRRAYIYWEYWAQGEKISTWAPNIARACQGEKLSDILLDPSAWGNRGDEKTINEQFYEQSGLIPRKADNDRVSGVTLYQEFLRWKAKPPRYIPPEGFSSEIANEIFRKNGTAALEDYRETFEPEKVEDNLPKLQIFKTCPKLIEAIPLCVYNDPKTSGNPEDVAEFSGDDPYDASRYLLKGLARFLERGNKKYEEFEKVGQVVKELEETKDQTRFYRKMEQLEGQKSNIGNIHPGVFRGVRRYHHVSH